MSASALAAVTPFEVILFGEYNISFFRHIIIFRIEFVSERHQVLNTNLYECTNLIFFFPLRQEFFDYLIVNLMGL